MIWRAMRLPKRLQLSVLIALAVPAVIGLTAITTLADSSPSPSGSASQQPLPGDPARGATLFGQNCAGCHGGALEGGVGPALNPIYKLPGVADPLDATWMIELIINGRIHQPGDPGTQNMPAKGGNSKLTDQDVKDLVAYIIQENRTGSPPLSAGELAKRTILWVSIAIIAMFFITFLLSQYNMRWIARRAAARRK